MTPPDLPTEVLLQIFEYASFWPVASACLARVSKSFYAWNIPLLYDNIHILRKSRKFMHTIATIPLLAAFVHKVVVDDPQLRVDARVLLEACVNATSVSFIEHTSMVWLRWNQYNIPLCRTSLTSLTCPHRFIIEAAPAVGLPNLTHLTLRVEENIDLDFLSLLQHLYTTSMLCSLSHLRLDLEGTATGWLICRSIIDNAVMISDAASFPLLAKPHSLVILAIHTFLPFPFWIQPLTNGRLPSIVVARPPHFTLNESLQPELMIFEDRGKDPEKSWALAEAFVKQRELQKRQKIS